MRTTVLALLAFAATAQAQNASVPTRTLTTPEIEFSEPYSRLMGVRELSDGRLIVSDVTEKLIALVDLRARTSTKIGTEGQGPGEYGMPSGVMAVPGDTTLVIDMLGSKYLKISPAGRIVGDVQFQPSGVGLGGGRMVMTGGGSGLSDAMGRIYSRGSNIRGLGADGQISQADSAPITRYDWRTGKVDTVTFMKVPLLQIQQTGSAGNANVQVRVGGGNQPFVSQPAWTVAPDGRIAMVTPEPFQVTWVATNGQKTVGEPIAYQRVRVTEAEKEAFRTQMKNSPPQGMAVRVENGARSMSSQPITFQEPGSWPEFKHPYAGAQGGIAVAPNGELWLLRQLAYTERNPTYDLIGPRGTVTGRVVLPQRTRLLGFGNNGAVYLVRRDADDLEYIQRHRLSVGSR